MSSIALVKDAEPLPQFCGERTLRIGNLARQLSERGHQVCWYTSTFLHYQKKFLHQHDLSQPENGFELRFLHVGGYRKNISLQRWMHHFRFALKLRREFRSVKKLDLIVCCIPMLEAALVCLWEARRRRIPLVLDIRDPWPEAFVQAVPFRFQRWARLLLAPYFWLAAYLFRSTDSLVAVSQGFLDWGSEMSGRRKGRPDAVVHHGAHDLACDDPGPALERWPSAPEAVRHIYMGGFATIYEFETLAALIERLGPEHHFFMVGAGNPQHLRLKERLAGCPRVTFTDWLPRQEAYLLAQTCHVGWLPLKPDLKGFLPNKPFEYTSLGLALATTRGGEVWSILESYDLGFAFELGEVEVLLKRLSELRPGSEPLQRWRRRSRRFWEEQGDARVCAAGYADHLEGLL